MSKSEMRRIAIQQGKDMDFYIKLEAENEKLRDIINKQSEAISYALEWSGDKQAWNRLEVISRETREGLERIGGGHE